MTFLFCFGPWLTEMAEAQIAEDMEYYKSEGLEVMYSLNSVLLKAKEIQAAIMTRMYMTTI